MRDWKVYVMGLEIVELKLNTLEAAGWKIEPQLIQAVGDEVVVIVSKEREDG